jgi:hypothetical protein
MYLLHRNSLNRYMFHVEDVRMNWQTSAKLVALTGVMTAMSFNAPSVTAQSKDLERTLAGVRLNASSRTVLSKFGNPNEIYIGDIGVRIPGTGAQQGGGMGMGEDGGMAGGPGMMGGMSGGAGPSMMGGMAGGSGPRMGGAGMMGSSGMMGGMAGGGGKMGAMGGGSGSMGAPGGMSGAPSSMMGGIGRMGGGSGSMGAPAGMSGAPSSMMGGMGRMGGGGSKMGGGDGEMGTMGGGMGGMMGGMGGMMGGMGGDTGGGVGAFGRTQSSVARQQEVTWVYNRTTKDAKGQTTAISYEFLINPGGSISQIRCLGYHSPIKPTTQTPSITTQKGIRLGSSYVEILRAYGQPDSYEKSGNILVLSYPKKHVQFQLINQKEQAEPTKAAYRVIAMTIATVEG